MSAPVKRPEFKNNGIKVKTLIELVENTAPFLFSLEKTKKEFRYVSILQNAKENPPADHDLWSYFELCIASHFATVGTFVPTDVDLAIRQKLWLACHTDAAFEPMWKLTQEFYDWNESLVSKRLVYSKSKLKLSGHQGEWFTIAMGAYGCALKVAPQFVPEIRDAIESEVKRHSIALTELRDTFLEESTTETMKDYLAGVAAVAHNLGDLDRMFELWNIADTDALKRRVFRSGHEDARKPVKVFMEAGAIYQKFLAAENHRHFALREPKPLRKSGDFLLTYAPFLEDWGSALVEKGFKTDVFSEGDLRDVVEALTTGWKKLNLKGIYTSQGYARALWGVARSLGDGNLARGKEELYNLVPPVIRKDLTESGLRTLMNVSKDEFERKIMASVKRVLNTENPD